MSLDAHRLRLAQAIPPYIHAACARGFDWGRDDCVTFAADYVRTVTGLDPLADDRATWDSGISAADRLALRGGLQQAFENAARRCGLVEIDARQAMAGDVGLVPDQRPTCGICTGQCADGVSRWALRALRGVRIAPFRPLRVWRIPEQI